MFFDFILGDYLFDIALSSPNEGELFWLLSWSEETRERKEFRNELSFENIIHRYGADDFYSHFRISRHTVSVLKESLGNPQAVSSV